MDSKQVSRNGIVNGPFLALRGLDMHPEQDELRRSLLGATRRDRRAFIYLWLTEGCPVGMEPWVYQWFREKVAKVAEIGCKEVSIVGSYRLGYSLTPTKYGARRRRGSDIDGLIVSSKLFDRVLSEARLVVKEHDPVRVPEVENCAKLNYVRTDYIKPKHRSSFVQSMHDCYAYLSRAPFNLEFDVAHSNFFIYRDWDSAIEKNIRFLCDLKRTLAKQDVHSGGAC